MNSIKQIEVIYADRIVGRLALAKEGLCAFEYTAEWLAFGFSISPFELPLRSGVFIAKPRPFDGGFGVFADCLPDGWGLLILDRYLQQQGINPRNLTLLDRLALVGSTGRGALEFRPDKSVVSKQEYADFEKLALDAEQILDSDDYTGEGIEEFQYRGGSPGGARPKIFTRYEDKEWLVKFRAKHDSKRIGRDEYSYSLLAKECGIVMPETRLFEDTLEKINTLRPAPLTDGTTLLILSDTKTTGQQRAIKALEEARRQAGRVIILNPIPQGKWKYIRSVQDFANVTTMISCSTLRDLAAACRRLT